VSTKRKKLKTPIEYQDDTGLLTPLRLAIMTGKKPSDFKEISGTVSGRISSKKPNRSNPPRSLPRCQSCKCDLSTRVHDTRGGKPICNSCAE
jgi:hypothetical protein